MDNNNVIEGDEAKMEENSEESGDEDLFESDSDSTDLYGEMNHEQKFPSVTSRQLHGSSTLLTVSPTSSPSPSAPSPSLHASMSQGTQACPSSCNHFDLDFTCQEDVRTMVETVKTAHRTHRNQMHAYFKKFLSKEAASLKPYPDSTEEQRTKLCVLFTREAFLKRSEQNKINRSKLTVNNAAGSCSFLRTRACIVVAKSIQQSCIRGTLQTKMVFGPQNEREKFMNGWMPSSASLAKTRDEIEAMRATREKYLQDFTKKQAEMEATLRDYSEEQRLEQERLQTEISMELEHDHYNGEEK
ncbi:hypothetical protein CJ030_MR1G011760 [Morella rubra]|uniref:Uncharacterized protein n=1 Tax=Morella rubra TaxID=262757 RepID=A0A6A1WNN0_9ROSI|nr:hypothetical protein CJ030_MR1G011760 [Morella rubra]